MTLDVIVFFSIFTQKTWPIIPFMDEKILSMDKIFICQKHPWMQKSYPWIKVSSMEKIMVNFFIYGFSPWMKSSGKDDNDPHGHRHYLNTCCLWPLVIGKFQLAPRKTFSWKFPIEKSCSKFSVRHVWISNLPLELKVCKFLSCFDF